MLTEAERMALLLDVHREIEDAARRFAEAVSRHGSPPELHYPPNHGYRDAESRALREVTHGEVREAALRKATASLIADVLYHTFSVIDGIADPWPSADEWGVYAIGPSDDSDDLHDEFYDPYWEWRAQRPDPGWRLDMHDGPSLEITRRSDV